MGIFFFFFFLGDGNFSVLLGFCGWKALRVYLFFNQPLFKKMVKGNSAIAVHIQKEAEFGR